MDHPLGHNRWLKKEEGVPDLANALGELQIVTYDSSSSHHPSSGDPSPGSSSALSKDNVSSATDSAFGMDEELHRVDFVSDLPTEVAISILCYVSDWSDWRTLRQVCKAWAALASDNEVWKALYLCRWGGLPKAFTGRQKKRNPKKADWKSLFQSRLLLHRNWKKGIVMAFFFSKKKLFSSFY
jgi:hypothetical protein